MCDFFIDEQVGLNDDDDDDDGYHGTIVGSHREPIDPCQFRAGVKESSFSGVHSYHLTNSDQISRGNPPAGGVVLVLRQARPYPNFRKGGASLRSNFVGTSTYSHTY